MCENAALVSQSLVGYAEIDGGSSRRIRWIAMWIFSWTGSVESGTCAAEEIPGSRRG